MPEKITHLRICKFMLHKKKKKEKIVLYFKEDTIDSEKLQSAVPSLTSQERIVQAAPSKKKKKSQERERERVERVRTKKKKQKEKEKEEQKGKEEKKKEEKKWRERY